MKLDIPWLSKALSNNVIWEIVNISCLIRETIFVNSIFLTKETTELLQETKLLKLFIICREHTASRQH